MSSLPLSRAEARKIGSALYIGIVCKRGHEPVRYTCSANCRECNRLKTPAPRVIKRPAAPASAPARLALVAQRIMQGQPFFAALHSVCGAKYVLARRMKVGTSTISAWHRKFGETVPQKMVAKLAAALNVPHSRIPARNNNLAKAKRDIQNGVPFMDALTQRRALKELDRATGFRPGCAWRWKKYGVPAKYVPGLAKLFGCDPSIIPLSKPRPRGPISDAERARLNACHATPEFREKARQIARSLPRNERRNQWVKRNEKPNLFVIAILLTASLALPGGAALARWRGKPTPEAAWFRSLYHNGVSCCAESDGHRLSPEFVRRNPTGKTQYQFKATKAAFGNVGDEQWHDIPDDKLVRGRELAKFGGNPTGQWVVFTYIYWGDGVHPTFKVYCAIPSSAT